MFAAQIAAFCLVVTAVVCDLPPGTRRNTYLPPEPTTGYHYDKPSIPFPRPTPPFPVGPTRPPFTVPSRPPTSYPGPGPRPTPSFPVGPRPTPGYPSPGPRPTPGFPDYTGQPSGNNGNTIGPGEHHDHHHHEPGMPFDFNYAVKEDAYGNDYSHNAVSDGDVTRGEYRVQLPDGRLQIVRYTADWKHGFNAQVSYEGTPRYDLPRPAGSFNRGY